MMQITIGKRCSGKTTRLIERSAREGLYILTATKHRAQAIFDRARDMGFYIPFPVTAEEYYRSNGFAGSIIRRKGLLIDDMDDVIQVMLTGIPIREVTMTDHKNIEYLDVQRPFCGGEAEKQDGNSLYNI